MPTLKKIIQMNIKNTFSILIFYILLPITFIQASDEYKKYSCYYSSESGMSTYKRISNYNQEFIDETFDRLRRNSFGMKKELKNINKVINIVWSSIYILNKKNVNEEELKQVESNMISANSINNSIYLNRLNIGPEMHVMLLNRLIKAVDMHAKVTRGRNETLNHSKCAIQKADTISDIMLIDDYEQSDIFTTAALDNGEYSLTQSDTKMSSDTISYDDNDPK